MYERWDTGRHRDEREEGVKSACRSSSWKSRHDISSSPLLSLWWWLFWIRENSSSSLMMMVSWYFTHKKNLEWTRKEDTHNLLQLTFRSYITSSPLHSVVIWILSPKLMLTDLTVSLPKFFSYFSLLILLFILYTNTTQLFQNSSLVIFKVLGK